ncbi:MAG: DUF1192 domain-containing protein [Chloroflexaceae bacterium]|nr:DUF1192 domain-containing protein [Chloroflexaceae bacterium]
MPEQLEERVAYLETEVERLKRKIESGTTTRAWWEQIVGTFANNSAYDEAMGLGQEYRHSLSSNPTESND